jgi:hypothetical protein
LTGTRPRAAIGSHGRVPARHDRGRGGRGMKVIAVDAVLESGRAEQVGGLRAIYLWQRVEPISEMSIARESYCRSSHCQMVVP